MPTSGRKIPLVFLCATLAAGCGQTGPRRPVSGTVTFEGTPVKIGRIQFFDANGAAGGALIRDGAFHVPAEQGLLPGTYRVWISVTAPAPELQEPGTSSPPTRELVPEQYNAKTTLAVDVTAQGPNRFSFEIPNAAPKR